jgi:hypothetical protein
MTDFPKIVHILVFFVNNKSCVQDFVPLILCVYIFVLRGLAVRLMSDLTVTRLIFTVCGFSCKSLASITKSF